MADESLHYVGIGELKVGRGADLLKATLGSCVGIAFIWRKGGRCGLAHCLLPESSVPTMRLAARYVNHAVPSLLMLMGIKEHDYPDIEVIVTGGACMFRVRKGSQDVGKWNIEAAEKYLQQKGLAVSHKEVGGRCGRQIVIDCHRQNFSITKIATQTEESRHEYP